jgi:hypothetical protein
LLPPVNSICLTFRPNVPLISSTRRYVTDFLHAALKDEEATSRVALAVHELLENTLRYSSDGEAKLDVSLDKDNESGHPRVEVRASNRTSAAQIRDVASRIDALSTAADPMDLYVKMMIEGAHREGSGLGLARIVAESGMDLAYEVEGDRLTICASVAV